MVHTTQVIFLLQHKYLFDSLYSSTQNITLLLKTKILDFETLSHVHVYRIEYVSYWQGPYRVNIVSAADCIVPVLINIKILLSNIPR